MTRFTLPAAIIVYRCACKRNWVQSKIAACAYLIGAAEQVVFPEKNGAYLCPCGVHFSWDKEKDA